MVRRVEAARAKDACVVGSARLAAVCGFAVLENMPTWFSPRGSCVFRAFYCSLSIAQAPWLLHIGGWSIGEEERQVFATAGKGAEEYLAQLSVSCGLEAITVSLGEFSQIST